MRALACALAFALAAYLALGTIAIARPASGPPRLELRAAGLHQAGRLVFEEWTRRSGSNICVISSADGTGEFPRRPLVVAPGRHWARFVFRTRRKPRQVDVTAWRRLDSAGDPVGKGVELPVRDLLYRFHVGARR